MADHFLAEFPPAIYLTPRPDLGDVSQGKLVSLTNYYQLFNGLLTPRQLEGLPPFYTDNLMHNLQTERFFKPVMINNMMAVGDGPIKTFSLRGAKDNPPDMHDERLLALEDTVEFFNLILGTKLASQEKQDLVAFLRTL